MSPIKSTFGRSVGKLLNSFRDRDLSLNSAVKTSSRLFSASGGTTHTPGNGYKYHVFTYPNTNTFTVINSTKSVEVLIVAGGGGGGGGYYTGGAGAGGVVYGASIPVSPGVYPVTVGQGGTGSPGPAGTAGDGGPSSFNAVTALGGGGGGSGPGTNDNGRAGGSAGGSSYYASPPGAGTASPQPVPVSYVAYGNPGGANRSPGTVGGGGGGAGGAGGSRPDYPGQGRAGGHGFPFPGFAGPLLPTLAPVIPRMGPTADYYGGGGSGATPGIDLSGGFGGGGTGTTGGTDPSPTVTAAGANFLGGGGGGRGNPNGAGGTGGDGVVIIRYLV